MNRGWTPESHVAITDAGMVIKIKLDRIDVFSLRTTFEENQLCVRGRHDDFGSFEVKFEIPFGYNPAKIKITFLKGVWRVEIPPGKATPFLSDFPINMLIYCAGCGKHFDIVIAGKGPGSYSCPACGKVQVFDLEALVNQVIEQGKKMPGRKRGRR